MYRCIYIKYYKTGYRRYAPRAGIGFARINLGHCKSARAHSEAHALRPEVPVVATATVDVPIRTIVEIRRVQRTVALAAAETPLVPHAVFRDHLLGGVHRIAATCATVSVVPFLTNLRLGIDAGKTKENISSDNLINL